MNRDCLSLNIAFESARLSYSEREVDLYNSGVNQVLSVAAACGHSLYHFSMADLYMHDDAPYARASIFALPQSWYGDPLQRYLWLQKIDECPLPLTEVQLCFFRADDVKHAETPNLDILRTIEERGILIESITATLSTCDKYGLVRRATHVPQPITYSADSLEEAMDAISFSPPFTSFHLLSPSF